MCDSNHVTDPARMISYVSTARIISYQPTVTAGADCRGYINIMTSHTQLAVHRYAAKDKQKCDSN